jgi:hemerythrin-like domain-containing protein
MKRHPGLHPLSQHHHFVLVQALEMRRATQEPAARRATAVRGAAQKFLRFWKRTGQQHFREEEEVLLPAYARRIRLDQDPAVIRMLAEHAAIRAQVQELESALENSTEPVPIEETVATLARALHDHVRFEENEVFPRMEKAFREADLQALGQRLTRLHPKHSCEV